MEVWKGALECPKNGITEIFCNDARLPAPVYGAFFRLNGPDGSSVADIYLHRPRDDSNKRRLPAHWREFMLIKELMHCWSPPETFVGTPDKAAELLTDLNTLSGPFGSMAQSDIIAVLAAAEVVLPYELCRHEMGRGKEPEQIGHEQSIHPAIAAYICRHDILEWRKDGCL